MAHPTGRRDKTKMKNVSSIEKQNTAAQVWAKLGKTPAEHSASMVANILKTFKAATAEETETGAAWYDETREFSARLAAKYCGIVRQDKNHLPACGCSLKVTAESNCAAVAVAVVSALSPLNKWAQNKIDAENVFRAYEQNETAVKFLDIETLADSVKVCTFHKNKLRAFRVIDENAPEIVQTSRKTRAFACNILNPASDCVTIDFHALSIAVGYQYTAASQPSVSDSLYRDVQEAYRLAARQINRRRKVKLLPYQVQAVTWLAWRRLVGICASAGTV